MQPACDWVALFVFTNTVEQVPLVAMVGNAMAFTHSSLAGGGGGTLIENVPGHGLGGAGQVSNHI